MFRTKLKPTIIMTLMTMLSITAFGCATNQNQASAKDVSQMLNMNNVSGGASGAEEVYNVVDVTTGDISEIVAAKGFVSLPIQYEISHDYEIGTVVYKNHTLPFGSSLVEKDQILAVLEIYIDPHAAEDTRLQYEKALYNYETSLEKKDKVLADLLDDINNEPNIYQKQILELDYEVALSEYNEYVEENTAYIEKLKETLDVYSQESREIFLTAPIDGIGESVNPKGVLRTGDVMSTDDVLARVSSFEKVFISIYARNASDFKFGETVQIKFTSAVPQITLTGKVISAPNVLHNVNSSSVTIEITSAFPQVTTMGSTVRNNASVVATQNFVQDGILIPASALSEARNNIGVVNVLENGTIVKKLVKYGYKGSDYAWILEGLEVGQQVTTK